jgi:hypothetical protein
MFRYDCYLITNKLLPQRNRLMIQVKADIVGGIAIWSWKIQKEIKKIDIN